MIDQIIEAQQDAQRRGKLNMWTVYDHPKDYPHAFVARRFEIGHGPEPLATSDVICDAKLHVIRACFRHLGLTPLPRNEGDDPAILETWL